MRLTVGPLPAAIYWRRRLLVLGILALVAVILAYSFAGGAEPTKDPLSSATTTPTDTASGPGTESPTPSQSTTPTPTAYVVPVNTVTGVTPTGPVTPAGRCSDSDIELTAQRRAPLPSETHRLTFVLKIKNISPRYCVRDIGSEPQELRLRSGEVVVWSSDDCSTQSTYHQDWTFPPGSERSFEVKWDGYRTRNAAGGSACSKTADNRVGVGSYQLVARLDALYYTSEPFSLVS